MSKKSSDYKRIILKASLIYGIDEATVEEYVDNGEQTAELASAIQLGIVNDMLDKMAKNSFKALENVVLSPKQLLSDDFAKRSADLKEIEQSLVKKHAIDNQLKINVNGRNYSLDNAVRFEFKNKIINNMVDSELSACKEYGHNLVKINFNSKCSPLCINRQNRIYWTLVTDPNYSELDPELFKNGGGLFHPHCRHFMVAYFPNFSDPIVPNVDKQQVANAYAKDQQIKYQKNTRKKYKQRMANAKATGNTQAYEYNKKLWNKWR